VQRKECERRQQQSDVDTCLKPYALERAKPMRVRVAGQQASLKEQQATGPDRGSAAKPRQDVTSDQGLDLEQKKSAEKDRDGKENMIRWEVK
jgi:hypothetical protein